MALRLTEAHAEGSTRHPRVRLPLADFERYVEGRAKTGPRNEGEELHFGDLYLACGCALGVPGAIDAFYAEYRPELGAIARRLRLSADTEDDLVQILGERLFVGGPDGEPRITQYSGAGPLRAWIRAVASRIALDLIRRGPKERPTDDAEGDAILLAKIEGGPDLRFERESHRAALRASLKIAFGKLPPRDRNLLRYALLDGLGIDELSVIYKVHRATTARWLVASRDALALGVRTHLKTALGLDDAACGSIIRDGFSQVDLTLGTMTRDH